MPKNFSGEIRAAKDVEIFLERPTLLLGLQETSLQGIIDAMLQKMITREDAKDINFDQARMAFFTSDSGEKKLFHVQLYQKFNCRGLPILVVTYT